MIKEWRGGGGGGGGGMISVNRREGMRMGIGDGVEGPGNCWCGIRGISIILC